MRSRSHESAVTAAATKKVGIDIAVEDESWRALPDHELVVYNSVLATLEVAGITAGQAGVEVSIVLTSDDHVASLNRKFRGKAGATNVLSFPASGAQDVPDAPRILGDVVLAAGVVAREAMLQNKTIPNHTSHLVVHGVLHLLGYDHTDDVKAEEMEALEVTALKRLGIPDPYQVSMADEMEPSQGPAD